MSEGAAPRKLGVGIVGAGDVTQIVHLPTLALLSHLYRVEIVCDISRRTAEHCAAKFHVPRATTDAGEVFAHPSVDVVFVLTSDEFHEEYAVAALRAGKDVMLEKPVTLSLASAERILAAERAAGGHRVFVGYMRRYAPSFVAAFKREVAAIPRILYARCRDFPGPNPFFLAQSGAFQVKHTDYPPGAAADRDARLDALFKEALGKDGGGDTPEKRKMCQFLGSLGSHDLSLMREALGMPESVSGTTAHDPFYTATFAMRNTSGEPYAAVYESGIDGVPVFDAHLAVYGDRVRVSIGYDTPFVKGLPIKVRVEEVNDHGEVQTREIIGSYEDAYTAELREMHSCFTEGREIKTSLEDAMDDLRIFQMMFADCDRQPADTARP